MEKRIAVITSGGDSPGMNPCISQIVKYAKDYSYKVIGYYNGYLGMRDNNFIELNVSNTQDWYKLGGTQLKTGRMPELKDIENQKVIINNLKKNKIDNVIVLGGDGSFKGALALSSISKDINFIGIPATIDNNIYGSDYSIGFDTALNKQVQYIDDISDTGMSLPGRVFFVETLGAWDGYLAHSSVLMGMADFSVLVEKKITDEEICQKVKEIIEAKERDYVLVTFAEGTYRMFDVAKYVKDKLNLNVKCNMLGYQQRGGVPTALERLRASGFAKYAVEAVKNSITNKYIVYSNGKYKYLDFDNVKKKKKFKFTDKFDNGW